ncbi:dispanin subfamily A member 2b-like [Poecilia latipinna]|uniref:Dispanin subfamily A member 2b-like n=2 Tax=Poecilia TaxID=8080 RepID=A0A096MB65_POEFO|nr:PREDICTED: dispanin subfamily A member 2b-like [Poecilia formosa]XP_014895668.1 PREDICTED: dispanin subfamily A member 2b-like [Poecilia latipinna]
MHPGYCNEASPGQHGGPTGVQHFVVTVPPEPPKDYLVWSLCSFVYGNFCCLGLAALIYSVKARDRKVVGDQDGAKRHGSCARIFNIVAVSLTSLILFIIIVVQIVAAVKVAQYTSQRRPWGAN